MRRVLDDGGRRASWRARGRRGCGGRRPRPRAGGCASQTAPMLRPGRRARAASSASVVAGRARAAGRRRRCDGSPRGARRCSRRSWPVCGVEQPDVQGVPLHLDCAADPARRRAVVRGLDFDAAVEVHRARRRTGSSETARAAAARARAAPRQTSRRPGAWSCRGCACRPSASPSGRDTLAPASSVSKRSPFSGVFCAWPTPGFDLALAIGIADAARQRRRRRSARARRDRADSASGRRCPA